MDFNYGTNFTFSRGKPMAYTGTRVYEEKPKTPLTQEVQDFKATLVNGMDWIPANSKVAQLDKMKRHSFTVQAGKRGSGVQLTKNMWPRITKNDYGHWTMVNQAQVYLTLSLDMLEMTFPGLEEIQQYAPGNYAERVYACSSMLMAMLWQKSSDMPEAWGPYIGPFAGVEAMFEEVTEEWLATSIMLDQINNSNMVTNKAQQYGDVLKVMRKGPAEDKKEKKGAKRAPKLLIRDLADVEAYAKYEEIYDPPDYFAGTDDYFA